MKLRLITDEARHVSILPSGALQLVQPDEVFTVPDRHADSYDQPGVYEPVTAPTTKEV